MSGYDASEWKPGDVAMVTGRWWWNKPHCALLAMRDAEWWSTGSRDLMDHEASDARRLVVIDPDDRRAVERFRDLYDAAFTEQTCPLDRKHRGNRGNALQAALREFANPAPRIEEPQGLGAVVEDAKGKRWVRAGDGGWWRGDENNGYSCNWASVLKRDVVRVLSAGVTP